MEETIYGIQAVRRPLPSLVKALDEQGGIQTIQFWKSWPDGARCCLLEIQPEEVPSCRAPTLYSKPDHLTPWRKLTLPRGGRYTFDPERDWWVAPADIEAIAMWVSSHDWPVFVTATPRRGP